MLALGLLSGGLDSTLAVKLIQNQGIKIKGIYFKSPFTSLKDRTISLVSKQLGIPIQQYILGREYFTVLRSPKYGYGKNLNPCIDCRIFMLKKAKALAEKIDAAFLVTGEVLNERPMTQNKKSLGITEKEAGLDGKILRPLSAKLLPITDAESRGWIDRTQLLDINGRSRKKQLQLANELGIKEYLTPAGGCLLTNREFAAKTRDLLQNKKRLTLNDIDLLRVGRHFRYKKSKIIVGRNEDENRRLKAFKGKRDYLFEVLDSGSPITLLQGVKTQLTVKIAAALTLRYSDREVASYVNFGKEDLTETLFVSPIETSDIDRLRIQ
jgi:tRNA U34 2-thiouridine synthase MnmA/TrmU